MKIGLTIVSCSLIYLILIFIIYFTKKKVNNFENKLYKSLLVVNILALIFEFCCFFAVFYKDVNSVTQFLNIFINKGFLVLLYLWLVFFTIYITFISLYNKSRFNEFYNKKSKLIWFFIVVFCLIMFTLIIISPLSYYNDGTYIYSYGGGTNILLVFGLFSIIINVIMALYNHKELFTKKYFPLLVLLILMTVTALARVINPGINIITASFAFITVIMYFTMENPDVKMIDLLARNSELVEKTVNDRSNLLFKISQELRKPVKDMMREVKFLKQSNDKEESHKILEMLEHNINNAYFIINDVANISSMDVKKFNVQESTYMTKTLFMDIVSKAKNQLSICKKEGKIKFNFKANTSFPENLYGDSIKLKQVILSIINNSIKYTKEGNIDLEIDAITRYDACRLIITITDTGVGIPLVKVNQLLDNKDNCNAEDFSLKDNLNLDIPTINKILKLQGGSINIKSKVGKGTVVTIVIKQEINYDSTEIVLKDVTKYNDIVKKSKKVIIAGEDECLQKIERILSKKNMEVEKTIIGEDVVQRVLHNSKYDLIILEDEMTPDSAYALLKKLTNIKGFKTPVVIFTKKDKEPILDHFIDDGFDDYILKEELESDVEKICAKYL